MVIMINYFYLVRVSSYFIYPLLFIIIDIHSINKILTITLSVSIFFFVWASTHLFSHSHVLNSIYNLTKKISSLQILLKYPHIINIHLKHKSNYINIAILKNCTNFKSFNVTENIPIFLLKHSKIYNSLKIITSVMYSSVKSAHHLSILSQNNHKPKYSLNILNTIFCL